MEPLLVVLILFAALHYLWNRLDDRANIKTLAERHCPLCECAFGQQAAEEAARDFNRAMRRRTLKLENPTRNFESGLEVKPIWLVRCPDCRGCFFHVVYWPEVSPLKPLTEEDIKDWYKHLGLAEEEPSNKPQ